MDALRMTHRREWRTPDLLVAPLLC